MKQLFAIFSAISTCMIAFEAKGNDRFLQLLESRYKDKSVEQMGNFIIVYKYDSVSHIQQISCYDLFGNLNYKKVMQFDNGFLFKEMVYDGKPLMSLQCIEYKNEKDGRIVSERNVVYDNIPIDDTTKLFVVPDNCRDSSILVYTYKYDTLKNCIEYKCVDDEHCYGRPVTTIISIIYDQKNRVSTIYKELFDKNNCPSNRSFVAEGHQVIDKRSYCYDEGNNVIEMDHYLPKEKTEDLRGKTVTYRYIKEDSQGGDLVSRYYVCKQADGAEKTNCDEIDAATFERDILIW